MIADKRPPLPFEEIVAPSGNPIEDLVCLGLPPLDDKAALLEWRRNYAALLAAAVFCDEMPRAGVGINYDLFGAAVHRHLVAVDEDLAYQLGKMERELGIKSVASDSITPGTIEAGTVLNARAARIEKALAARIASAPTTTG